MSSGARRITACIKEVTAGITPDGAATELKRTSFGLNDTIARNDSDEIGRSRMAQRQSFGTTDLTGDIGTMFRFGNLDDFLASCFGADWTTDGVLTLGNDRISFSIFANDDDVGVNKVWRGCQVDTLQLTMPGDGDITATTTMNALNSEDRDNGTPYYDPETLIDAPSGPQYSFIDIKNLEIDGEPLENEDGTRKACVDNFNLQFANNIQVQRCIGTGTGNPGANIPTTFQPTGTIVLSWAKYAYELWAKNKSKTAVSFQFDVVNEEGGYRFFIPQMDVSGDYPDGGAQDIIQVSLDFAAHTDAPTITKLDAEST